MISASRYSELLDEEAKRFEPAPVDNDLVVRVPRAKPFTGDLWQPDEEDVEALLARVREPQAVSLEDLGYRNLKPGDLAALRALHAQPRTAGEVARAFAPLGGKDTPFMGAGLQLRDLYRLQRDAAAIQAGTSDRDAEMNVALAQIEAARDQTFAAKVTDILGSIATTGAEFGATVGAGGVARVGASAALKVAKGEVLDQMAKRARESAVASLIAKVPDGLRRGAGLAAGVTGAQELVPRIFGEGGGAWQLASARRAFADMDLDDEEALHVATLANESMGEFVNAKHPLWKGMVEKFIENGFEQSGGLLARLPGFSYLAAVQTMALRKVAGTGGREGLEKLAEAAARGIAYDGPLQETLEEIVGGMAVEAFGQQDAAAFVDGLPQTVEDLAALVVASTIPGLGGAVGARMATVRQRKRDELRGLDQESTADGEPAGRRKEETSAGGDVSTPGEATVERPDVEPGVSSVEPEDVQEADPFEGFGIPFDPREPLIEQSLVARLALRSRKQRVEQPMTLVDFILEKGGFDLRTVAPGGEGADLVERVRSVTGRLNRGVPQGFIRDVNSVSTSSGLSPDDMRLALKEEGFGDAEEFDGRMSFDDIMDAVEAELAGERAVFHPSIEGDIWDREGARAARRAEDDFEAEFGFASRGDTRATDATEFAIAESSGTVDGFFGSPDTGVRVGGAARDLPRAPVSRDSALLRSPETFAPAKAAIEADSIGRNLFGALVPVQEITGGESVDAPQVVNAIGGILRAAGGSPVLRQGRAAFLPRGARGGYWIRERVIDLRRVNDITTAAHEVGHALEVAVFGKADPWLDGGAAKITDVQRSELESLGRELYGATEPSGGYLREGWAEFVSYFLTQDGTSKAPAMMAWMRESFLPQNPQIADAIRKAQDYARTWRYQGSHGRAQRSIAEQPGRIGRAAEAIKSVGSRTFWHRIFDDWVEALGPLKRLTDKVEAIAGVELDASKNPFLTAKALRQTAASRVKYMIERGMISLSGDRTGVPPLAEIRSMIAGREGDFAVFLFAKRARALWEQPLVQSLREGETVSSKLEEARASTRDSQGRTPTDEQILASMGARDPGLSYEDAKQVLREYEDARFEPAAERLYQWYDGVMDYVSESSETLRDAVAKIRAVDPGYYIPLQRVFEKFEGRASRRGSAARGSVSQRLKGSGRQIKEPVQQLIAQATQMVELAHNRFVLESVINLAERYDGIGGIIREVPVDKVPGGAISVDDALRQAAKRIAGEDADAAAAIEDVRDALGESADQVITLVVQARQPKQAGEAPILPVVRNGKVKWYQVEADVHDALAGINPQRLAPVWDAIFGVPKRLFVQGTTQLSASFALITNPLRDIATFVANSSAGNPARSLAHYFGSIGAAFNASTGAAQNPDTFADFMLRSGARMAQRHKEDGQSTRALARRLKAKGLRLVDVTSDKWEWFKDALNTPELIPRIAEVRAKAEQIGWEPGQPLSMDQSIELLLAAKEVTVDFAAAGKLGQRMNQVVPFFNVAIQSPRAMLRAFKRNPAGFVATAVASATLPAIALWYLNRDEEWYQDMDEDTKYRSFYVRVGDHVLRIPRAFELHTFFATVPEVLLDALYAADPDAATSIASRLGKAAGLLKDEALDVFVPNVLPTVAHAYKEHIQNKDDFFDVPIVPRSLEDAAPQDQFNEYTSRAARRVGDALGVSPMVFEHYVSSVFGTLGRDALQLTGQDIDVVGREAGLAGIPVVGRLFQRGGVGGVRSQSVEDVYEKSRELLQRQKHYRIRGNAEPAEERQERLFMSDVVAALGAMSRTAQIAETQEQRGEIMRERRELAREALADYRAGTWRRMRPLVRQLEAREEAAERRFRSKVSATTEGE